VAEFIDVVFAHARVEELSQQEADELLSKVNFMLTTPSLNLKVRTAADFAELKTLLIQTSWIPVITGDAMFNDGHIDGYIVSAREREGG
jgi:hypothetical protein